MPLPKPIRVLCVEDDPAAAKLLQKTLIRAGFVVHTAIGATEGLAAWGTGLHDVLTTDHNMPGMTGLDLIRALASRGPLPPTVMITGAGNETVAVEAMKLGADDYVIKDGDAGYLELMPSVIEKALARKLLREEARRAEEALGRALTELERRVAARIRELSRLNEQLAAEVLARKQAQEKAAEALDFTRRILATPVVGIATYNASGQCVMANEALATMVQGPLQELLTQNFREIRSWEQTGLLRDAEDALATKRENRREVRTVTTFGREAWLDYRMSRFEAGGESHLLVIVDDITERREAETARRETETGD